MSRFTRETTSLTIGGEPRIDLMPAAFKEQKQNKRRIRSLATLAILVAVVCAGGYVFATGLALQSQSALADEQAKTPQLIRAQGEFIEAQTAADQLATANSAKLVGSSAEILWQPYLAAVYSALPPGVAFVSYAVSSQPSTEAAVTPTLAYEKSSAATITLNAATDSVDKADSLASNLREVPGFVDASVLSIVQDEETKLYAVNVRLTVSDSIFERRFFPEYVPGAVLLPSEDSTEGEED